MPESIIHPRVLLPGGTARHLNGLFCAFEVGSLLEAMVSRPTEVWSHPPNQRSALIATVTAMGGRTVFAFLRLPYHRRVVLCRLTGEAVQCSSLSGFATI